MAGRGGGRIRGRGTRESPWVPPSPLLSSTSVTVSGFFGAGGRVSTVVLRPGGGSGRTVRDAIALVHSRRGLFNSTFARTRRGVRVLARFAVAGARHRLHDVTLMPAGLRACGPAGLRGARHRGSSPVSWSMTPARRDERQKCPAENRHAVGRGGSALASTGISWSYGMTSVVTIVGGGTPNIAQSSYRDGRRALGYSNGCCGTQ